MNVTSVIVRTKPENLESVMVGIRAMDGCDIHFNDEAGRIVVTIESESGSDDMPRLRDLSNLPNVISAGVVYTFSDDGLPKEMFELPV